MQIYGKVKRTTEKAILFAIFDQANELPTAFHGKELWFPLSACFGGAQRHTDSLRGDAIFAPQFISVPDYIMTLKAEEVGCREEWTARIAAAQAADKADADREAADREAYRDSQTPDNLRSEIARMESILLERKAIFALNSRPSTGQLARHGKEMRRYEKSIADLKKQLSTKEVA